MDTRSVSPAQNALAVTPSDTTVLGARGLWVGGAGAVAVDFRDGSTGVVFSGVPAGTFLPIAAYRVKATGTTATLIVAVF